MAVKRLDRIHIRELRMRSVVGIFDWEKNTKQDVSVSVTLHADLSVAGQSDSIDDTVDYKKLKNQIMDHVENGSFGLVERMAEEVADICLSNPRVEAVDVFVDKLGALRYAKSVAVEISRGRM